MRDFAGPEELRRELAVFCCAPGTSNPDRIQADGTLERERYMLRSIHKRWPNTRSLRKRRWSSVRLSPLPGSQRSEPPPEAPAARFTRRSFLTPSFVYRIVRLLAGNRAPQFYQLGWDMEKTAGATRRWWSTSSGAEAVPA